MIKLTKRPIFPNCQVPNGYSCISLQVIYNCSAFGSSYFWVSFSRERKSERIDRKFKTQNPNLSGDTTHLQFRNCFHNRDTFLVFHALLLYASSNCSSAQLRIHKYHRQVLTKDRDSWATNQYKFFQLDNYKETFTRKTPLRGQLTSLLLLELLGRFKPGIKFVSPSIVIFIVKVSSIMLGNVRPTLQSIEFYLISKTLISLSKVIYNKFTVMQDLLKSPLEYWKGRFSPFSKVCFQ